MKNWLIESRTANLKSRPSKTYPFMDSMGLFFLIMRLKLFQVCVTFNVIDIAFKFPFSKCQVDRLKLNNFNLIINKPN